MNDPSAPRRERSGLCVGGPLAGRQLPTDDRGFITVPAIETKEVTDEPSGNDATVAAEFHRYREETFHTPQGAISFWAPVDQSPLDSLWLLLSGYMASLGAHEPGPGGTFTNPLPIDTAPKDGTPIYAWDGVWWRERVRWAVPSLYGFTVPCWVYDGFLDIHATHWLPADCKDPALRAAVARGYRRVDR